MVDGEARVPETVHGWWIVLVGTLSMTFTFGTPYSYGLFLGAFAETFDVSRVTLSTVFSVELFAFYAGAGVVGVLVTRLPARAVLLVTGGTTALLAPSLYVVDSLAGLFVVFGLLGTALGTVYVVLASVVPQWFRERRGLATGVLFMGNGLGLLVLPPAWRYGFEQFGVRRGFLIVVGVSAVSFLLAGAFCRRPPWSEPGGESLADLSRWLVRLAGGRGFQLTFLGMGLAFAWYYLLAAYAVDLFVTRGLSEATATLAFGFIGGVSVFSRVGSGVVADRFGYRRTFLASLGLAALGSALLLVPSAVFVFLSVCVFGLALGAIGTLYIPILMRRYDPEKDTAIIGVFNVTFGVFALAAPPVGTALIAYSGSYSGVTVLTLLASIGAICAVWLGTPPAQLDSS
ncbi:MFS transporter [Halorarum halobium]|uniref:MFS transporter n=1 Tax=Halorarum halobium TaxID=3075121 RepID=UPI0028AB8B3B|nr:MFS transporter [Halobaculum sp. XH14]